MLEDEQNQDGGEQPQIEEQGTDLDVKPDPPADAGGEPRQTRKERREERGRNMAAENRALTERLERAERERQSDREALAEMRGRIEAGEKLREKPAGDDFEERLSSVRRKIENAVARMGKGDPDALEEWHKAMEERDDIRAERREGSRIREAEERISRSIPQRGDPQLDSITSDYPFLAGADERSQRIKAIANGHVNRLVLAEGRDMQNPEVRYATLREGAALAARDAGIQTRRAPTDTDRDRYAGTRGGDSGAGNGGGQRVHLSAHQMKLAESLFNSLPPAEAHQKWWAEIGRKAINK